VLEAPFLIWAEYSKWLSASDAHCH
jgi:hypothetical protein